MSQEPNPDLWNVEARYIKESEAANGRQLVKGVENYGHLLQMDTDEDDYLAAMEEFTDGQKYLTKLQMRYEQLLAAVEAEFRYRARVGGCSDTNGWRSLIRTRELRHVVPPPFPGKKANGR